MILKKDDILVRGGSEDLAKRYETPRELMHDLKFLTSDELWWIAENFALSEDEYNAFCYHFGIHNSHWVVRSRDIDRCVFVSNCERVENSRYVFDSSEVYETKFCWNSKRIHESEFVKDSRELIRATRCLNCKNSDDIVYSQNLNFCNDIWLSANLVGCSHCLCCHDLENAEYHIFNHEVRPQVFEKAIVQLKQLMDNSDEISYSVATESFANRFWFNFLRLSDFTEPMLDFITNLPYYDSKLMGIITYDVRWNLYGSKNDT